jgi:hypothetical protein
MIISGIPVEDPVRFRVLLSFSSWFVVCGLVGEEPIIRKERGLLAALLFSGLKICS